MTLGKIGSTNLMYHGLTARDYVQDGLIWQIDGIENAGFGQHSEDVSYWTNLKTGDAYAYSKINELPNWKKDGWESTSSSDGKFFEAQYPNLSAIEGSTVEIVSSKRTSSRGVIIGSYGMTGGNGCNFEYSATCFRAYYSAQPDVQTPNGSFPLNVRKYFCSTRVGKSYAVSNGHEVLATASNTHNLFKSGPCRIGCDSRTTSMCFNGEILSIRLYSRALTAFEIATNYAIDRARFNLS